MARVLHRFTGQEMELIQQQLRPLIEPQSTGSRVLQRISPEDMAAIERQPSPIERQPSPNVQQQSVQPEGSILEALGRGFVSGGTLGKVGDNRRLSYLEEQYPISSLAGNIAGGAALTAGATLAAPFVVPAGAAAAVGVGSAIASKAPWAVKALRYAEKIPHANKIGGAIAGFAKDVTPRVFGITKPTAGFKATAKEIAKTAGVTGGVYSYNRSEDEGLERLKSGVAGGALSAATGIGLYGAVKTTASVGKNVYGYFFERKPVFKLAFESMYPKDLPDREEAIKEGLALLRASQDKTFLDVSPDARVATREISKASKRIGEELTELQDKRIAAADEWYREAVKDGGTKLINIPETINKLDELATTTTSEMYDNFVSSNIPLPEKFILRVNRFLDSESAKAAFRAAKTKVSDVRIGKGLNDGEPSVYDLFVNINEKYNNLDVQLTRPLVDEMYKSLGDMAYNATEKSQRSILIQLRNTFKKIIDDYDPQYGEATAKYRAIKARIDALELGQKSVSDNVSFNQMRLDYQKLLDVNSDVVDKEKLALRFKDAFVSQLFFSTKEKLSNFHALLQLPDFRSKIDFLFGRGSSEGLQASVFLEQKANELLKYADLSDVIAKFKGTDSRNILDVSGVPSTWYRILLFAINAGRYYLRFRQKDVSTQEKVARFIMMKQGREKSIQKIQGLLDEIEKAQQARALPSMIAARAGGVGLPAITPIKFPQEQR